MLHIATCLWAKNEKTHPLSGSYNEGWAERLYRSFSRHLAVPFRFTCFVDREREFREPIHQELLSTATPGFANFTEPYRLNEPMILVGLDTIVTGPIGHFAEYCLSADKIALLRDPKSVRLKDQGYPNQSINGVALVPAGWRRVYDEWDGVENDMAHLRKYPWECIDDRWPGQVASYKMHVRSQGNSLPSDARIVYFHGQPKATDPSVAALPWVKENWA